jgi:pSer/pThr/pTyr-binding forkhead associated (FHA) protein
VFKLTIEDDEGKTTVVPLVREEMTIGRQEGNTIRLTERNVSRRHARLVRQNGSIYVEDLASFTGVRVNGAKIASLTPVREGDQVLIGDYKLMVRDDQPPVAVNGDRTTSPAMTAALGPIGSVGGSVAIPTRATAAMAAQAQAAAPPAAAPAPPPQRSGPGNTALMPAAAMPPLTPEPSTPDPLDGQPTMPVRTLGESAPPPVQQPQPEVSAPARLVVLTTELAGLEFALKRGSIVLGRTDENEIVLNHRSISRHHAKVVRDGDHYTIVDLQSANGVRVNGEDYERIELHPGDMIELGHVKLRFVGPFEHYVFDPNARHGGPRMPFRVVVAVGGVALAAVVGLAVQRGLRSRPAEVAAAPAQHAAPAATAEVTPLPAAPAPPAAEAPAPEAEGAAAAAASPADLMAAATRAAAGENWDAARVALDRLGLQPNDPALRRQALDLRRRIDTERQGALSFARFDEASTAKNYAEAVARYGDIPSDSVYKKRAHARYDEARQLLVAQHINAAEKARTAGQCVEVRQEADEIARLDPRNQLARDLVRLCRPRPEAAVAQRARPEPSAAAARTAHGRGTTTLASQTGSRAERSESGGPKRASEPAAAAPAAAGGGEEVDVDAVMKQAREAWMRGQYGSAIDYARKALRAKPGMTDAYQIIAASSCSLKDAEGATRAYAKLDDKSRNLVHSLCQKNGIVVGGE